MTNPKRMKRAEALPHLPSRRPCSRSGEKASTPDERGVIIVFLAAGLVLFLALVGLSIGVGAMMLARESSQNSANAVALAALESWVSHPDLDPAGRAEVARERAQELLDRAQVLGASGTSPGSRFGTVRQAWESNNGAGGAEIRFGRMYPFNPATSGGDGGPCQGQYPCFVHYPSLEGQLNSASGSVNAVQVILETPTDNPLVAPFSAVFGSFATQFRVEATATMVQRCTALLVDLSPSSFSATHRWTGGVANTQNSPLPRRFIFDPDTPDDFAFAGFAFNSNFTTSNGNELPLTSVNCSALGGASGISADPASVMWCNTRPSRAGPLPGSRPWDGATYTWGLGRVNSNQAPSSYSHPPGDVGNKASELERYRRFHYRDDYLPRSSPFYNNEVFLIDSYVDQYYKGPEPFSSYMRGFNAALRALQVQQNALDKATLKGFAGFSIAEIPPALLAPEGARLTGDLGYLIQITNMDNRGTFTRNQNGAQITVSPQLRPNFVDHGFFTPVSSNPDSQNTNLVEILHTTIEHLTAECPANSKKQIILATDGVSSCSFVTHKSPTQVVDDTEEVYGNSRSCSYDFDTFLEAECQLMGMDGESLAAPSKCSARPSHKEFSYPSILERLIQERISLTVLLAGVGVEPNFRNLTNAETLGEVEPWSPGRELLLYPKAVGLGLSALNDEVKQTLNYVEHVSSCGEKPMAGEGSHECESQAYLRLGSPGYVFRRANGLARMAMRSGGLWCPLMPLADPGCYDESGSMIEECKISTTQITSPYNIDSATLAAQCTSQAVGYNPFLLLEPSRQCENGAAPTSPGCV